MLGTRHDKQRLAIAAEIGATQTLNIDEADPLDLVRSLGDGYGADLVVDCSGVSIALQSALEMVRPNGTITKIGWGPQPMDFNLDPLVQKGVTLQGCFSHLYDTWERALNLLSTGQIDLAPIIGGVYPLANWEAAFEEDGIRQQRQVGACAGVGILLWGRLCESPVRQFSVANTERPESSSRAGMGRFRNETRDMVIWRIETRSDYLDLAYVDEEDTRFTMAYRRGKLLTWRPIYVAYNTSVDDTFDERHERVPNFPRLSGFITCDENAKSVLHDLVSDHVDFLPLLSDKITDKQYFVFYPRIELDCLDVERLEYGFSLPGKRRPYIETYAFQPDCIGDTPIFILPRGTRFDPFVSDRFKDAIESNNLTGLQFKKIWEG